MEPVLRKSIAEYIAGKRKTLTLIGNPVSISVMYEAINTSRNLYILLNEGSVEDVSAALEKKRIAVERYEKITGISWGL